MNHIIEVDELTKQYNKSKTPSVDNICFNVDEGDFFAFLGPNGAGKTTTISILTTTLSKTSGSVKIAGYDLDKQTKEVRNNIGIIFQKASFDPTLTSEQNIRLHACLYGMYSYRPTFKMMPKEYRDKVLELSEIVGIRDAIFKPIKNLSGGMQRKLEIIRSLIHTPKILFLDEPTQGLDAESRRNLWDYINEVRRKNGITVFLTTHYIDEAENVDKACLIINGKIAILGSPEEMKSSLLKQELIMDAEDRNTLVHELTSIGVQFSVDKHFVIGYDDVSKLQFIMKNIKTKLNMLKIYEPTLEDAYVELIKKSGEVA